jgi:peptidoglycan-N-acetylmuramic acid deacetylase
MITNSIKYIINNYLTEFIMIKRAIVTASIFIFSFFLGGAIATIHNSYEKKAAMSDTIDESGEKNWGLGFSTEGQPPSGMATADELKKYDAYYIGDTKEKVIYLTFDAGYENGYTSAILDALKKHNVHATFFLVGNYVVTSPDLVKRMVKEGHNVANHTFNHPNMSCISTKEDFSKELGDLEAVFEDATGEQMKKYYRPPQGKFSINNLKMAKELGYKTFFWSLAYVDWYNDKQPSREEAFKKLLGRIHPGAIVLLHSTSKTNSEILDELLTKWEEMGYTFGSLDDVVQ